MPSGRAICLLLLLGGWARADAQVRYERYPFFNVAGNAGFGTADGVGSAARFNGPAGVASDRSGNVYVADGGNGLIRKIAPDRRVTTLAGGGVGANSPDGNGSAARFGSLRGIAVDAAGNVFVADSYFNSIRKVTPEGAVTTVAGISRSFNGAHVDGEATAARFKSPTALAMDAEGNLYIADSGNRVIRKLSADGIVTTVAGVPGAYGTDDGDRSSARFASPTGIALDHSGNIYVSDVHLIRKISPDGSVSTIAGGSGLPSDSGSTDGPGRQARF